MSTLRPALAVLGSLALITGLAYPLAITGAGRVLFPRQAAGSLILREGRVLGSRLIAQHTEDPRYFWGRLSATDYPTDAGLSGGSNLAPSNPALRALAEGRIRALRAADPGNPQPVPADLVTASASGLDPHITPAGAEYQVGRVARVRGLPEARVRALVARATRGRVIGLFGEPRVDVLELNLSLDGILPVTQAWFIPLAFLIGLAGTQSSLRARHLGLKTAHDRSWWLLMVLAWVPLACWCLSQFIAQD